jgi:predicted nucleic acid-binding protein
MPETNPTRCFLDTNVWLYAFVVTQDPAKSDIAKGIIQSNEIIVSVQVINELSINLIKKAQFDEERIQRLIASFYVRQQVIEVGKEVLLTASDLRARYRFSFWDSLIVASALIGGSSIVYSEDMDDGLLVDDRLRIVNPFRLASTESE